jgi:hypothetical protein
MNPITAGRRWRLATIPISALAALALAACGGGSGEAGIATAVTDGAPTPTATATAGSVAEYVEGVRNYAKCMRENGVADFPDPGPRGEIEIGDLGKRKSDQTFVTASQKCKSLHPPMPADLRGQGQRLTEEQIANAREYARCMRANGVPDFRDPGPDGRFGRDGTQPQSGPAAAKALRAGQLCEPVLNGQPPATDVPSDTGAG